MNIHQKHTFLAPADDLAVLINKQANLLYQQITSLDISNTDIDEFAKYYFTRHHTGRRLFYSVQSSADIIYKSVKKTDKPVNELVFIDYGAGLGTLFLLAGLTGFKRVYFNDYFPEWADYAKIVCGKLGINIDGFISGDIDAVIRFGKEHGVFFDIVASRNVVEHIYNLRSFYSNIYQSGISSICYSTTTANYHNPAVRLKHYWYHYNKERKMHRKQRADYILQQVPEINKEDLKKLVELSRGRAVAEFGHIIKLYFSKQPIPKVEFLYTNTCDCFSGVWAENLITRPNYADIIEKAGFTFEYTAGFWDTHYKYGIFNLAARSLNYLIKITGKKGYFFAPFVNIIATKK